MSNPTHLQATAEKLKHTCDAYYELQLRRHPHWASELGDYRWADKLPDFSEASRTEYYLELNAIRADFYRIDAFSLSGQDAVTYEVMEHLLRTERDGEGFRDECWSINPLHGPWTTVSELADRQPIFPRTSFEQLRDRYLAVPTMMGQIEQNLRDGLARGTTTSRIGPERVAAQLRRMIQIAPEVSSFIPKRQHNVPDLDDTTWAKMVVELAEIVQDSIYPVMEKFATFLERDYLTHARTAPGLCHMPGGREFYQYLIELYTSRVDTAEHIHQVGLEELARVHEEMKQIAFDQAGTRDIKEFVKWLRAKPDQYLHTREAILAFNRGALVRAEAVLPKVFARIPTKRVEVRPIEQFREMDSPSGYYSHAPDDGSRPAVYYLNCSRPEARPTYNMEALAFHEAVPGHHLQIALAQELSGLHPVRRHIGHTAFVEGWALYSERLCDELGLYSSPWTRFGMLNYQAWRAARLVLDTGIHAMGWSREKALDTMVANTAHSHSEAAIEIDRYICMPGQALAYMTGRMAIDALRKEAEERFGSRFDLKTFHSFVLDNGSLPLSSLERLVHRQLEEAGV